MTILPILRLPPSRQYNKINIIGKPTKAQNELIAITFESQVEKSNASPNANVSARAKAKIDSPPSLRCPTTNAMHSWVAKANHVVKAIHQEKVLAGNATQQVEMDKFSNAT